MNAVHKVNHLCIRNERLDELHPFLVVRVLLQVVGPILFVLKQAEVAVGHAALDRVSDCLIVSRSKKLTALPSGLLLMPPHRFTYGFFVTGCMSFSCKATMPSDACAHLSAAATVAAP